MNEVMPLEMMLKGTMENAIKVGISLIQGCRENQVNIGKYGSDDAAECTQQQTDGGAAPGFVTLVEENRRQYIGDAQKEVLNFSGQHGTASLKDQLQQNLYSDDLQCTQRSQDEAADELWDCREIKFCKG